MAITRGLKYLVIALACFPFVGAANILISGAANSFLIATWFFIVSAAFCLYFILRVVKRAKKLPGRTEPTPSVYFRAALVFLFGSIYGIWILIKSGWEWVDLAGLAVPMGLVIWLAHRGITERRRRRANGAEF